MLEFSIFESEHLNHFEPQPFYKNDLPAYEEWLKQLAKVAQAGVHMKDGKMLYLSAFSEIVPGTWEVMIIPSVHLPRYAKSIVKDIKAWLDAIHEAKSARRIQTWGEANDLIDRWLKHLGFTCEGTLRQYDAEGDKRIWAKVW